MEAIWSDVRFAWRMIRKSPAVTLVAVLSLALGIGANTTIFTFVNALFLHPLPFVEPSRLVALYTHDEKAPGFLPLSHPNLESFLEHGGDVFSGLAAYGLAPMSLSGGGEPEQVQGEIVSGNYFDLLGVEAAVGRTFLPEEDRTPGTHPVVVLGHAFWSRRFGADPGAVGKTLTLNGQPFTIIGVSPAEFRGTATLNRPDLWVPMQMHDQVLTGPFRLWFNNRRALLFNGIARLRPGVSVEQARAEVQAIARSLAQEFPNENQGRTVAVLPLAQTTLNPNVQGNLELAGAILMGVVGLVLLVACANVANLLLARAAARQQEIAIRLAIGAGRRRLVRQLLTESLLMALASGVLGLLLAYWLRDLLWTLRPPIVAHNAIYPALDARVLGFTLLVALVTGVLFGLVPALQSTKPEVLPSLKGEAAPPSPSSGRRLNLRGALVVVQVALSLLALLGAGLFLRSLRQALTINPGFETENLAVFTVNLDTQGYEPERGRQLFDQALERLNTAPGVRSATLASNLPLTVFTGPFRSLLPQGKEARPDDRGTLVLTNTVDPRYFDTMGMRLLGGRAFTAADREEAPRVAIVNQTLARMFWGDQNPVGKRFRFVGDAFDHEVVGLVRDVKHITLGEEPLACAYLPVAQNYSPFMTFLVRAESDPASVLLAAQREVRTLDSNLPLINVWTVRQVISESLWAPRMAAALLGSFGLLALLLAALGIYSLMTYFVNQRSREIGIHLALGARRGDVFRLVLRRGMVLVFIGIAIGLLAGWLATRLTRDLIAGLLYQVSATDPVAFLSTALLLAAIALLANLIPARRAMRVPPMMALRNQ